jgi:hypothetical protein
MATLDAKMPEDSKIDSVNQISQAPIVEYDEQRPPIVKINSYLDDEHVNLGWRSWMVVFVTCFALVIAPSSSPIGGFTHLEQ